MFAPLALRPKLSPNENNQFWPTRMGTGQELPGYLKLGPRDGGIASVVEKEVLSKHRKDQFMPSRLVGNR
jgi:hypothetical protein